MPKRIAILGGGAGALATAFELTSQPGWKERFEITVYQTGWRLGGKGASGRNLKQHKRIEEHGLHLWLGCYENAFRIMRECYAELARAPGQPLATWQEAFTPWPISGVMERIDEEWFHWVGHFRRNDAEPGQGEPFLSVGDLLAGGIEILRRIASTVPIALEAEEPGGLAGLAFERAWKGFVRLARRPTEGGGGASLLATALRLARGGEVLRKQMPRFVDAAATELWRRIGPSVERNAGLRRLWIAFDLTATVLRGLVADDVTTHGFDALDEYDLVEWLKRHGASDLTVNSGFVRGMYDFAFADHSRPNHDCTIAAGAMMRLMLRMMFNYRGSMFYRMEGGMGDVVFAPLYLVLARRGVKFEFFHEVKRLGVSPDGRRVETVELDRQVRLLGGRTTYEPLVDVDGLPCWPSEPCYEQLERGDELEAGWTARNYNLEAWRNTWTPAERRTLQQGRDFDLVVLGISLGVLPFICQELIAQNPRWQGMLENIPTVPTQSLQLWLRPDLRQLGWTGAPATVAAFAQPFNTYADMAHLLPHERWPSRGPGDLAYLCGPLSPEDCARLQVEAGPPEERSLYERGQQQVRENAVTWLTDNASVLWPRAGAPGRFDWEVLYDPEARSGQARLDGQYLRANVDPSERYVRAPRGNTRYRLHPADSGFENLYLAGDWTWNGMNLGNVEAAVSSGMLASRAISGYPMRIAWSDDGIARPRSPVRKGA
jgi:uncharacterized protein with NAD-binding domain and iron-sulfur cluster